MEIERGGEFAIGCGAAVGRGHDLSLGLQVRGLYGKGLRRLRKKQLAHLRRRVADRSAAVLHRLAASGESFIRSTARICGNQVDVRRYDIECFSRDLDQRGADALPELGLAGEGGDRATRIDAGPAVEETILVEATG